MAKVVGKSKKMVKKVTCRNCASIIEYTQREVQSRTYSDYGGGTDSFSYITCPECKEDVEVRGY